MKLHARHVVAVVAVGLCFVAPSSEADPGSNSFDKVVPHGELRRLSAEWWQWALSIPTPVNPLTEGLVPMGPNPPVETCMVGQRGPIWFLAGVLGSGTAVRTCTLPEGKELFFPVINQAEYNTPNICGQPPVDFSVEKMRSDVAPTIDNVSFLKVTLDHKPIHHLHRVQSDVFDVTLPEDNILVEQCKGDSPPGVFSPGVDDGIYVFLRPLDAGTHKLRIQATSQTTSGRTSLDVTYTLVIVPVTLR